MIYAADPIHRRAVQRATEIAEGVTPLAACLQVAPVMIAAWIQGTSEVPAAALLRVIEVILDHAAPRMRGVIPPSLVESFKHREAANC
jgi:hypothetical protein